jgi:hypothetical protein
MAGIPEPLPGPTRMDVKSPLIDAAITFAFNPKSKEDASAIKIYSMAVEKSFKENYLSTDPRDIAIATVTAYLKSKTRSGGGSKTYRKKKHLRKTRKM